MLLEAHPASKQLHEVASVWGETSCYSFGRFDMQTIFRDRLTI